MVINTALFSSTIPSLTTQELASLTSEGLVFCIKELDLEFFKRKIVDDSKLVKGDDIDIVDVLKNAFEDLDKLKKYKILEKGGRNQVVYLALSSEGKNALEKGHKLSPFLKGLASLGILDSPGEKEKAPSKHFMYKGKKICYGSGSDLEKANYVDSPKNRKLNRVGKEYDAKKGSSSKKTSETKGKTTLKNKMLSVFKENKGPLTWEKVTQETGRFGKDNAHTKNTLDKLIEEGHVVQHSRGIYAHKDVKVDDSSAKGVKADQRKARLEGSVRANKEFISRIEGYLSKIPKDFMDKTNAHMTNNSTVTKESSIYHGSEYEKLKEEFDALGLHTSGIPNYYNLVSQIKSLEGSKGFLEKNTKALAKINKK